MKIPHRVRIKPRVWYDVVYVDRFPNPTQYGECFRSHDWTVRVIKIKRGLSEQMLRQAFWHELLHAFEFEYNMKIPHFAIYALQEPLERFFRLNGVRSVVGRQPRPQTSAAAKKKKGPRRGR
jgi:hypothetical protein